MPVVAADLCEGRSDHDHLGVDLAAAGDAAVGRRGRQGVGGLRRRRRAATARTGGTSMRQGASTDVHVTSVHSSIPDPKTRISRKSSSGPARTVGRLGCGRQGCLTTRGVNRSRQWAAAIGVCPTRTITSRTGYKPLARLTCSRHDRWSAPGSGSRSRLASRMQVSKQTTSEMAGRLVREGYFEPATSALDAHHSGREQADAVSAATHCSSGC